MTWRGAADAAPLLVALALARGGATRLRLQLVSLRSSTAAADAATATATATAEAAADAADAAAVAGAWRAWACAAGLAQLEVLHAPWPPPTETGGAPLHPQAAPLHLADLIVLLPAAVAAGGEAAAAADGLWELVHAALHPHGVVLGVPVAAAAGGGSSGGGSGGGGSATGAGAGAGGYAFLSGGTAALQLHLRAPQQRALSGRSCAACAVAAATFFEAGCQHPSGTPDGAAGGGGDAAAAEEAVAAGVEMAPLFFELVAAWPVGYRLEEKCGALWAYVGDALEGMCAYHGCDR